MAGVASAVLARAGSWRGCLRIHQRQQLPRSRPRAAALSNWSPHGRGGRSTPRTPGLRQRRHGERRTARVGAAPTETAVGGGWALLGPEGSPRGAAGVDTDLDAIVMLAGGQVEDGSGLPENVELRLDACLQLAALQDGGGCPVLCTGGGTPHKPPILRDGYVYHESSNCADYLMSKGLSATNIFKEVSSFDTIGNGYFSLTIHAIPRGWRKIGVVTSDFHMPRSKAIFDHCFSLANRASLCPPAGRFELQYYAVPDKGYPDDVLAARREREAKSLASFKTTTTETPTLADFSLWMHSEHMCYAVPRQGEFGVRSVTDDKALASY